MEILEIKNFLLIKEAKFEVKRFNIIIGTQASGKSVVAKVLYFFKKVIFEKFSFFKMQAEFEKNIFTKFEQIFPRYTWNEQEFCLSYTIDNFKISIIYQKGKESIEIRYSTNFIMFYEMLEKEFSSNFSIFIPANRSSFSILQKNIFFLLANDFLAADIDYFIKEFGSLYEKIKSRYLVYSSSLNTELENLIEQILVGKYVRENQQDWIMIEGKKIDLAIASSGQQESLPLLLTLSIFSKSDLFTIELNKSTLFIEEPEAHLFPISQKHLVSIFSFIYNTRPCDFVITTHSPYILTAMNNMIMATIVGNESTKKSKQVNEIIDKKYWINPKNVSAYTLEDGILKSIIDEETQLIGENIIDSVSDEFGSQFDALLDIQAN